MYITCLNINTYFVHIFNYITMPIFTQKPVILGESFLYENIN